MTFEPEMLASRS